MQNKDNLSTNKELCWQAVLKRDSQFDGKVVYGVVSTGIYCRPSCPSRKPKRQNVVFFALPEVAQQAGFQTCKRCKPDQVTARDPQVELVRKICRYIENALEDPLTLNLLSDQFDVSPYHLQRTFKKVVGITPQKYTEACRLKQIKGALSEGDEIMNSLYDAGYASTSRLYSKASAQLGMTPKAYKKGGQGVPILFTTVKCSLGYLLVAATEKGICAVQIGDTEKDLQNTFLKKFDHAEIEHDDTTLSTWLQAILSHLEGKQPHLDLPLDVQATAFQQKVWQALQEVPYGATRSYAEIAQAIGKPKAVRAVANACANNPTALLIPCHRIIRSDGNLGGYRWGMDRKQALLEKEAQVQ